MVLCGREKDARSWNCSSEGSLGEERNESVKSKDCTYMCLNGNAIRKCNLPQVTEFKYREADTLQSDCDMTMEVNKRTPCGWNNLRKMSGFHSDKRGSP